MVTLESVETGAPLLFLDTHYEDGPGGEQMRREGTRILLNQIERIAPGLPSIVVADFNCNPWSPAYRRFLGAGFVDAYRAAGHGDSAESSTFHGFRGREYFGLEWGGELFWRVDWMLLRDGARARWQPTSCTIARDTEPPVYASDHYPRGFRDAAARQGGLNPAAGASPSKEEVSIRPLPLIPGRGA
jgi:endonuclease/exonuclease/phosphatase family metal-dependent hydrolase